MALRRTRSPASRPRRPRRKLVWARSADGVAIVPPIAGETFSPFFPLGAFETTFGANLIGCTIMAVRGVITAAMVATEANANQDHVAARFGVRITDHVDNNSVDYARGSLYNTQAHADWFVFEPFMLDAGVSVAAGEEADATSGSEIRHIAGRSRRKLEELGQVVELLVDVPPNGSTQPVANTQSLRVRWDLSFLVALP